MVLFASDYDKSKYLRAEDVKQDKRFRIKAVTEEIFERDGGKEKKLVLWFTNDERGLVLNKTNIRTLRGAFDDDTTNWVGKVVAVFAAMTDFRGKMTPALRVRIPPPKQATDAAPQQPQQPATSGNGVAAAAAVPLAAAALAAADPELNPDPVKPLRDEMEDEIPF
jgi:hypothetical protein